jgi:Na+-driven multidrug efflux pump
VAIGALLAVFPDLWLGMFLEPTNTETLDAGRAHFRIVAPFYAFFGQGLALYFACQGAGRMLWPVVSSLSRIVIAFGGATVLTSATSWGVQGVFVAISFAMLTYGIVIAVAIKVTRWR